MEYALILNPTAGSGYPLQLQEALEKRLGERQIAFRTLRTEAPGHATALARELAADRETKAVVAVGGDGTVGEVAAGLVGTEMPMGIIPAGTGNDLIKTVGIPKEPMNALDFLLSHEARLVDTGKINEDFFLNVCGAGFDVKVLDCTEEYKSRFRGLTPYLLGLLKAISKHEPVNLTITHDGVEEQGEFLVCSIANGKYIGGGIPICPAADATDGKLNLVMIRNVPRWKIPFYLPGLMMSRDLHFRITRHLLAEKIVMKGKNIRVNIDGAIRAMDEAAFQIIPASLRLIC